MWKERSRYQYHGYDQASSFVSPVASFTNTFPAYSEGIPVLVETATLFKASKCFKYSYKLDEENRWRNSGLQNRVLRTLSAPFLLSVSITISKHADYCSSCTYLTHLRKKRYIYMILNSLSGLRYSSTMLLCRSEFTLVRGR